MDKSKLLGQGLPEEDLEIEGVGTIRIRALSRYEIMVAGKANPDDVLAMEQQMLSIAVLDPKLTEKEVAQWQKSSPLGQVQEVIQAINRLSGVTKDSQKEAYKSLREDSQPGV